MGWLNFLIIHTGLVKEFVYVQVFYAFFFFSFSFFIYLVFLLPEWEKHLRKKSEDQKQICTINFLTLDNIYISKE